jgi:hypothetical protein
VRLVPSARRGIKGIAVACSDLAPSAMLTANRRLAHRPPERCCPYRRTINSARALPEVASSGLNRSDRSPCCDTPSARQVDARQALAPTRARARLARPCDFTNGLAPELRWREPYRLRRSHAPHGAAMLQVTSPQTATCNYAAARRLRLQVTAGHDSPCAWRRF